MIQPANDLERLYTDHLVRNLWRTMRSGHLETAAIEVEMSEHKDAAESRWANLDSESLYHLSTRDPSTRSAIREYGNAEGAALRSFKHALRTIKIIRSK